MYENDEGDLVPLAQNDQRIDISLRLLPSNTEMPHPYEENFSFTRTFGGVIGREDSPGSISFVSAPLVPGKRRTIISALAGTLDDNPATVADTGEFVGPL